MFNLNGLYGFCGGPDEGVRVFFHAGSFERENGTPLPVVGEQVEVEFDPDTGEGDQAPRAARVVRLGPPTQLRGKVKSFSPKNGWGFIQGEDGVIYYLHRSEVEGGRLPLQGQEATFYAGRKNDKPRACYVHLGRVKAGGPSYGKR